MPEGQEQPAQLEKEMDGQEWHFQGKYGEELQKGEPHFHLKGDSWVIGMQKIRQKRNERLHWEQGLK